MPETAGPIVKPTPKPQDIRRSKRGGSMKRRIIGTLVVVLLLLVMLPLSLYIPSVQDFVSRRVVEWLNVRSDDYTFSLESVRIDFPLRLRANGVDVVRRVQGDTLLHVGSLRTGLDDLPLHQPYFVMNRLQVRDVRVAMDSLTQSLGLVGRLKELEAEGIELDPANAQLRLADLVVSGPDLHLCLGPSQLDEDNEESSPWFVAVEHAVVREGHLCLDIGDESLTHACDSVPAPTRYFDYQHVDLTEVQATMTDARYDDNLIRVNLMELAARDECSGLELQHLATRFVMEEQLIALHGLDLRLAGDAQLRGDALLDMGMLDSLRTGQAEFHLQAVLDTANLIRLAAPYLPRLAGQRIESSTELRLDARLTPDTLDLRNLTLNLPGYTLLKAEAFAEAPFDAAQRSLTATVQADMNHSDVLLSALLSPDTQRAYLLPDSLQLSVETTQQGPILTARCDVRQYQQEVLAAEARFDQKTDSYHLSAAARRLAVSAFLPQLAVDDMTLHLQADGRHFTFPDKWTRLEASMQIDSLSYRLADGQHEQLHGIMAQASLLGGSYVAEVRSEHPTAQFHTRLEGLFLKDTLTAQGRLDVPLIDLAHLPGGLSQPDLGRLGFRSQLALAYNWGDVAEGGMRIDSLTYEDDDMTQCFDHILMTLESRPGMLYADVTGGDAALCLNTERGISEFPQMVSTLTTELNRQLDSLHLDFSAMQHALPQGQMDFHIGQDNPFYPAINHFGYQFRSIDMAAYNLFNLNLDACIVGLRNEDRTIDFDSIIAEIRPCQFRQKGASQADSQGYRLNAHALHIDPKARDTYDIHAHGLLMPDSVMMDVCYVDGNYVTLYDAAASLAIGNDTLMLRLERDPVLFAQPFTVNPDNYISLMQYRNAREHQRTHTSAKVMMKGPRGMALDIYTRKARNRDIGNQMLVRLQNLDLDFASKTVMWDGDVHGRLDLTAMADLYPDSLGGQLRAGIKTFRLGDYEVDTLSFDGRLTLAPDQRDMAGTLTIDSIVKLQLDAALADTVHLLVGINDLPLPLANLYMPSDIRLAGTTSGELILRGKSFDQAHIDAALCMNEAQVCITDLDGSLTLPPDTLRIRNNRMTIQNYKIGGVNRQPITLRGSVDMRQDLSNPTVDLRISGENVWLADNRRLRLPDQYISGRLPITTDIRVKGTPQDLNVSGRLQVLSGTDLKYYLKEDPLQATSRVDQLVEFVSFRQMDRELAHSALRPLVDGVSAAEGVSVELQLDIARDVKVDAFLPGEDNNHVAIVGGGPLVMQCAPNGSLAMSGVYDVTSGTVDYKLPILPMTKKFNILNSSLVSWNGTDPGSPSINIQASENVRTTVSTDEGSRLVQFLVTISITGTLDALDMAFTCSAPDDGSINSEIEAMTDEERSKTALMLLVAQTYMGGSNRGNVGMGTANAALNSVLNRQMDQMLGSALKNTDVDLGIDTYSTEAGAARTDYSIKVSQRLFNDRIRATIGGRVSSGGDPSMGNGARLGDMSLEWLIKKDGTHYLKLYRRYNYQSVLEGEVLETGVAYAQERTAYKFKHLLIPTSRSRQARIMQAIRERQQAEETEVFDP